MNIDVLYSFYIVFQVYLYILKNISVLTKI